MPPKMRLSHPDPLTDEWGLYDPAKAGMPALFARLGKPLLRQPDVSARRGRRRSGRVERSNDGVCLAIEEVRRRAFPDAPEAGSGGEAPRDAAQVDAGTARPTRGRRKRLVASPPPPQTAQRPATPVTQAEPAGGQIAKVKMARTPASPIPTVSAPATRAAARPASAVSPRPRGKRTSAAPGGAKSGVDQLAIQGPRSELAQLVRPRGPVPLAAWAHSTTAGPLVEPNRDDVRGLWRTLFRIPSEVALVEYGRGCRIHRLVIESPADVGPSY